MTLKITRTAIEVQDALPTGTGMAVSWEPEYTPDEDGTPMLSIAMITTPEKAALFNAGDKSGLGIKAGRIPKGALIGVGLMMNAQEVQIFAHWIARTAERMLEHAEARPHGYPTPFDDPGPAVAETPGEPTRADLVLMLAEHEASAKILRDMLEDMEPDQTDEPDLTNDERAPLTARLQELVEAEIWRKKRRAKPDAAEGGVL